MNYVAPEGVAVRPRTPADTEFLASLYASTRAQELAPVPWPDEAKRDFLRQQFDAQTAHYDQHYADAEFLVIERDGSAIGRLIVWWGESDTRIVDVSLLPAHCRRGIGSAIVSAVIAQAPGSVSIHVEHHNPALRLYQRLGFTAEADTGVYYRMRRNPHFAATANGRQ